MFLLFIYGEIPIPCVIAVKPSDISASAPALVITVGGGLPADFLAVPLLSSVLATYPEACKARGKKATDCVSVEFLCLQPCKLLGPSKDIVDKLLPVSYTSASFVLVGYGIGKNVRLLFPL